MAYLTRARARASLHIDVNELQFIVGFIVVVVVVVVVVVLVLVLILVLSIFLIVSSSSPPYHTQHTDWKVPSVWKLRVAGAKLPSSAKYERSC